MKGEVIGRIYELYHSLMEGKWFWGLTADGPGIKRPVPASGYVNSARAAGVRVEEAWFAAKLPDDAPPPALHRPPAERSASLPLEAAVPGAV